CPQESRGAGALPQGRLFATRGCGRKTAVRRGGRVDAALGACRTDLRIYVATTAGDPGRPAAVPGCRPPMTGTARPREVRLQRMSGSDERAAIRGAET